MTSVLQCENTNHSGILYAFTYKAHVQSEMKYETFKKISYFNMETVPVNCCDDLGTVSMTIQPQFWAIRENVGYYHLLL